MVVVITRNDLETRIVMPYKYRKIVESTSISPSTVEVSKFRLYYAMFTNINIVIARGVLPNW